MTRVNNSMDTATLSPKGLSRIFLAPPEIVGLVASCMNTATLKQMRLASKDFDEAVGIHRTSVFREPSRGNYH